MIVDNDFDKVLWIMLASDKKNRMDIAKLIYSLPEEIIDGIKKALVDRDKLEKVEFSHSVGNFIEGLTLFRVIIDGEYLKIKLSKFNYHGNETEDTEELEMAIMSMDKIMDKAYRDIIYLGGYSYNFVDSALGSNFILSLCNGAGYEMFLDPDGKIIVQVGDNRVYQREIDLDRMPKEIDRDSLDNRRMVKRLVKGGSKRR